MLPPPACLHVAVLERPGLSIALGCGRQDCRAVALDFVGRQERPDADVPVALELRALLGGGGSVGSERGGGRHAPAWVAAHRTPVLVHRVAVGRDGVHQKRCHPRSGASVALDLGCGPGHTSRLVASITRARQTVGVERSAGFVVRAEADQADVVGLTFARRDVVTDPLPGAPADLVFCRYLLTHLPDPAAVMGAWAAQLAPGGRLLVEEVEEIRTDVEPFRRYLDHVADLLRANGQRLDIGPSLHALAPPPGVARASSKVATLQPIGADVVAMFRPNLATWRDDPAVVARVEPTDLDDLDAALAAQADRPAGAITWRLRQLVWERTI